MEFFTNRSKGGTVLSPLLVQADRVASAARESGALVSIPTFIRPITDHGTEFSVRIVGQLARKAETTSAEPHGRPADAATRNPFLPYEPALHVADLRPHHVCLLNKFNVVDQHLLLVTRHFASQQEPLDAGDFAALAVCLAAADGIGFYNGGPEAGASQRHKHLQWIPVPPRELPLSARIETLGDANEQIDERTAERTGERTDERTAVRHPFGSGAAVRIDHEPTWPFRHRFSFFTGPQFAVLGERGPDAADDLAAETAAELGVALEGHYRRLLDACRLAERGRELPLEEQARELPPEDRARELPPYNLLVTRRWMLLVPRRCEHAAGISCNSLAFAGALLVKDQNQWEALRSFGPWQALRAVTFPQ